MEEKGKIIGLIPEDVFVPPDYMKQYGSNGINRKLKKEASYYLVNAALADFGLSPGRLWIVLGGSFVTGAYEMGRKARLSRAMTERLAFLYILKYKYGVDTSRLKWIDWKNGVIHTNESNEHHFAARPTIPHGKNGNRPSFRRSSVIARSFG